MKKKTNISDALLVNYLLGELNAKDAAMVERLLRSDDEHKKALDDMALIWQGSGALLPAVTVDAEASWQRFRQNAPQQKRRTIQLSTRQMKVAAALILLMGLATLLYQLLPARRTGELPQIAATSVQKPALSTAPIAKDAKEKANETTAVAAMPRKAILPKEPAAPGLDKMVKEQVCNSSSSPIEICIVQKLQCPGRSSLVPSCSRLNPDEAGQIKYRVAGRQTAGCQAIVDEIIIKKVATGETLVLNENSKPMSAKELFSYMTGEKKGDVLAGEFNSDCLAFNSTSGDFMLQPCSGKGD